MAQTWELSYLLTDHLSSVVAITDDQGDLVSQQRYLPFGGVRTIPNSPITNTDFGYTSQRNLDSVLGLMDYKARFYSPVLNRFIQPDSIVPDSSNPQAFNRFSYVINNPINLIDPSGHCYYNGTWIPNGQDGTCSWQSDSNDNGDSGGSSSASSGNNDNDEEGGKGKGLPSLDKEGNEDSIIFILTESELAHLSEHYEDISQTLTGIYLLEAVVGVICFFYCQAALLFLAVGFAAVVNESIQAQRISDAFDEAAHWANQNEYSIAAIEFKENETLGIIDQISYTDDLGYMQSDNIFSLFLSSWIKKDLETYGSVLPFP